MGTLRDLELAIRSLAEERARGDAFERAVLAWLTGEPELGLRAAWRWADWPERARRGLPASDDGVDLVAVDADGALVAVQAKFRSDPDRPVRREEVQKALSYPDVFDRYLVVSNAWARTRSASRGLAGEARLRWALREELEASAVDWLSALAGRPEPTARRGPRPHQERAVADAVAALREPGRAQVRMACGTGKTLAALWVAERLGAERVLVLAPTLLLLKQLRAEWLREADAPFAALAVCSAADVGEGADAWQLDPADIPGHVTTDPAAISGFLRRGGRRVVFSTYQSSPRVAEAMADVSVPGFGLAVADEAHKIAGVGSRRDGRIAAQRTILDGARIRTERRLFLTATPRVYGAARRRHLEDAFGVEVASMDDEAVFGRVAHEFAFRSAVEAGILADYRLLVTVADDEAAAQAIRERAFVDLAGRPVDSDQVASAVAVRRAVGELGLSRVISFHSTVARAREFARLLPEVPLEVGAPGSRWISGAQPVRDRELVLSELRHPAGPVVVANARCLTEGIDVPALDAVAFVDPRRSPVDLVQAIGRAMRSSPGKSTGWVIVPVHLGPDELADPEAAVASSAFEPVIAVLRALRAHDPLIAADAARIRLSLGPRSAAPGASAALAEVPLDVVGPAGVPIERLVEAIRLKAVEVAADPWATGLAALRAFVEREGHARVPIGYVTDTGQALGSWASRRRLEYRAGRLRPDRAEALEELPAWTWVPFDSDFEEGLFELDRYVTDHGDARVPQRWRAPSGFHLGTWVNDRRSDRRAGLLTPERAEALESVAGWTWDPRDAKFDEYLGALREFVGEHGHARVPKRYRTSEGLALGAWVANRRTEWRDGEIGERAMELASIPEWTWTPHGDDFESGFARLTQFAERHGHSRVPHKMRDPDGFRLGAWVANRRNEYRNGGLAKVRAERLEALQGWSWLPYDDDFEVGLRELHAFVSAQGHARVPDRLVSPTGYRLGSWVSARRMERARGRLSDDRLRALERVPGWTWDPRSDLFERGLASLRAYAARFGDCRVPHAYVDDDGFRLGAWVLKRRAESRSGGLRPERADRLESVPGWLELMSEGVQSNRPTGS